MLVTSGETVPNDNSDHAQTYAEFVTVNTGLGNRATTTGYRQHKECQMRLTKNIKAKLNENHILFDCEQLEKYKKV